MGWGCGGWVWGGALRLSESGVWGLVLRRGFVWQLIDASSIFVGT